MNEPRIRVLIVDDFAESRLNIRKILESVDDIRVVGEARSGEEAVELYDVLLPDVVSMDTNMLEMDGFTAMQLIRGKHKDARIFMLTVNNELEYVRRAMRAGAEDYLLLPAAKEELIETVRYIAGRVKKETG
jgi:YesN/AraC family two-component response regulator